MPLSVDEDITDILTGDATLTALIPANHIGFGRFREGVGPPYCSLGWDVPSAKYYTTGTQVEGTEYSHLRVRIGDKTHRKATIIKDRVRELLELYNVDDAFSGTFIEAIYFGSEETVEEELDELHEWRVYIRVIWDKGR